MHTLEKDSVRRNNCQQFRWDVFLTRICHESPFKIEFHKKPAPDFEIVLFCFVHFNRLTAAIYSCFSAVLSVHVSTFGAQEQTSSSPGYLVAL